MNEHVFQAIPYETSAFLSGIHSWGIDVIKVIQRIESPGLTAILKFVTALGTEAFYIPVILFIFWWIDEKRGLRFGILIIVSAWVNSVTKDLLKQPRPFNYEPSLGLAFEPTYGAPSGHAQMSLSFWIPMAAWLAGKWKEKNQIQKQLLVWAGAVFIVLLIGFTRLYLGVHFPTDLFAGWILAGIILIVYFIPGPRLEKLFAYAGVRSQNICAAAIALVMNGLHPKDRMLPALFLGFCIGYTLMKKYFPFSAQAEISGLKSGGKKPGVNIMILRCLTGFAGIAIIYLGLKFILPGNGSLYELGRFIRYGLIGLWASAGAPWIFRRLGLASSRGPGKEDAE